MFDFHRPAVSELAAIKNVLLEAKPFSCDYSPSYLIGWCTHYDTEIAYIDGCLVDREKDIELFGFPKGENWLSALKALKNTYTSASFCGLTETEKTLLESAFPGEYEFQPSRESNDYIYNISELATLTGKKYHSKRNHISYFKKNYDWSYEEITPQNLHECIAMNEAWYLKNIDKDLEGIDTERNLLDFSFKNYESFGFTGGLLRVDGKVVAFTFGEPLNDDLFDTHFEKAYAEIRGAYPMINFLFAQKLSRKYKYVNREDDAGSEGLRKAKLSYHPEIILKKYTAVKI